jgi:CheY-like chemotaxis protein
LPALAADRDFVGLIKSLNGPVDPEQLQKLLSRPLTPDFDPAFRASPDLERHWLDEFSVEPRQQLILSPGVPGDQPDQATISGVNMLWIDDHPLSNRRLTDLWTARGANVTVATDRTSAIDAIEQATPAVILSDFDRNGVADGGINDLEFFRSTGLYTGPVIFCSGRGNSERRRRVAELGALGPTNDENEINRLVYGIVSGEDQPRLS